MSGDPKDLQTQNQQLIEQVNRLVRVERLMIESQEKLDRQVNLYRRLNEMAKRLKGTFVVHEILEIMQDFLLYDLNFERCLIFQADADRDADCFVAQLWDGYEDEAPLNFNLCLAEWPILQPLIQHRQDFVLVTMAMLPELGQRLGMDEFMVNTIRSNQGHIQYLIAFGNTQARVKCFERIQPEADYLVVVSNLLAQVSGAIEQALLYQATHDQAATLQVTLEQLQSTQSQLIQTEKMSSLGQLVAGIAHEINNPVNFIHGNLDYAATYTTDLLKLVTAYESSVPTTIATALEAIDFEFLRADLPRVIASMQTGTSRIQEIVLSLRNFSRMDESEFKSVDLHDGIDSTLLILQHRLKLNHDRPEIQLIKHYGELPPIECAAGLVNQVFMNLLSNAIDALELVSQPEIQICTTIEAGGVLVRMIDNGPGIPEKLQHRLFDPFFTTKPVGKGTGLGLSISYQIIVEKHQGRLECHSTIGQGTEFQIWLPLKSGRNPARKPNATGPR
jgi:signal transduction histidine kinase